MDRLVEIQPTTSTHVLITTQSVKASFTVTATIAEFASVDRSLDIGCGVGSAIQESS